MAEVGQGQKEATDSGIEACSIPRNSTQQDADHGVFDAKILLGRFLGPPHWDKFRPAFRIQFLKFMLGWFAIVPVIVKFLSSIPREFPLNVGGTQLIFVADLPFRWWVIWIASVIYILSFFFYLYRCPKFIKKWPNYSEYKGYRHNLRFIIWQIHDSLPVIERKDNFFKWLLGKGLAVSVGSEKYRLPEEPKADAEATVLISAHDGQYYEMSMQNKNGAEEREEEYYWSIQEHLTTTRVASRFIINIFLWLCAALVLFSAGEGVYFVMEYLLWG